MLVLNPTTVSDPDIVDFCKSVMSIISSQYSEILNISQCSFDETLFTYCEKIPIKPIILLPPIRSCCGELITIRNRPSYPIVYTMHGTSIAAMFSGECRKGCGSKFHYSYCQIDSKVYFYHDVGKEFFHITSQTVFSTDVIKDVTNNISISANSFQSRAEVYNENHRDRDIKNLKLFKEFGRSATDSEHPYGNLQRRELKMHGLCIILFACFGTIMSLVKLILRLILAHRRELMWIYFVPKHGIF